ncbi:hypothetical protein D3C85_1665230 [compost metagenome]
MHLGVGQADLASDHAPATGHAVGDVEPLDGVGGLGIVFADLLTQWRDGFVARFGLAQIGGELLQRVLNRHHVGLGHQWVRKSRTMRL